MLNAISLFAGCGGCSLGLKEAGFDIRLSADINQDACATYGLNFGEKSVWQVDLSHIQPAEVLQHSCLQKSEINLIVGGPPCQGFSSAGARDWSDPRNALLKKFVEIIIELRPIWFVMENVEGLLTANDGFYIIEAITRFLEAGYWVRTKKVYMEQHGLPQKRKRVFVVGNLEQCEFVFPTPSFYEFNPLPLLNAHQQMSILDAISDLPQPTKSGKVEYNQNPNSAYQHLLRRTDGKPISNHQTKQMNEVIQQRIKLIGQGETMKHLPPELQHPSFKRRAFRRVMDGTPTEKRGGAPSGLKRLIGSQPSLTITSASSSEFIHPTQDRLLTLRECARIQSFPDWFEFVGSWNSISTQIGNAIPPFFMRILAEQIINQATWVPAKKQRGRWLGIDSTKANAVSPVLEKMLSNLNKKTYVFVG